MSSTTYLIVKPLTPRLNLVQLSQLLRLLSWLRAGIVAGGISLGVLVGIQLVYPSNWTRPLLSVQGMNVGFQSSQNLRTKLSQLNDQMVVLKTGSHTYRLSYNQLGLIVDASTTTHRLTNYSLKQRLTPLSLLQKSAASEVATNKDQAKLRQLATKIAHDNTVLPINASLARQADGSFKVQPETRGVTFTEAAVVQHLTQLPVTPNTKASLSGSSTEPTVTTAKAQAVLKQINDQTQSPLTVIFGGATYTVPVASLRAWTSVQVDPAKGDLTIVYDHQAIQAWLKQTLPGVAQAPGTSVITIVDGDETSRTPASTGIELDTDKTAAAIEQALAAKQSSITASNTILSPLQQIIRQYTPTSKGLQALITYWQGSQGVMVSVSFQEIGGSGRQASLNANQSMPAASLYKMFVIWYVLRGVENGSINPNDQVVNGKNISACIEAMIVVSDNDCGLALRSRFGDSTINAFIHANGFSHSSLTAPLSQTSASDMASLLIRLQAGQLLNASDTNTVLGYMGRQQYRSAIPAGSPGNAVQDKVGFIGSTWNDAAIVQGSKSTYVLVVLTQGGSPSPIRNLAQQIQNLLK